MKKIIVALCIVLAIIVVGCNQVTITVKPGTVNAATTSNMELQETLSVTKQIYVYKILDKDTDGYIYITYNTYNSTIAMTSLPKGNP